MDDWDWELLQETQNPENEFKYEDEKKQQQQIIASSVCDDCGVIRSDYFSLDSHNNFQQFEQQGYDEYEYEDESSDNPSWVDPTNITVVPRKERSISCSNSDSSDPSDSRNLLLLIDPHTDCAGVEAVVDDHIDNTPSFGGGDELNDDVIVSTNNVIVPVEEENGGELYSQANGGEEEERVDEGGRSGSGVSSESNEEVKRVVWWKVPLEVVKYCVLRVSPVWSLSMAAAAVMGLVILRRRFLYRMKRKTQGLQLKVTVDDKKVSQFMSRAARLNEAFSVVKRVPIIRPTLPAPGLATWPMMSLR